ncbi:uncharacterized protein LOC101863317 [Aplysia californica]|uniref:Uncharacterized protein LOC101863317 n=1 Tax=Aplysia californica TaxID=6500 RepID=A0ABM0K9T8_APLCA|nr:uncharacterized protein LOC101863317 [Aplysia californica]
MGNAPFAAVTEIKMSEKVNLQKWDESSDGRLTNANMKKKLESMGYRTCRYMFSPGTDFPDHTHNITKMDAITSGRFQMGMYGQTLVMEPGDILEVPKNTVHNAKVVGSEDVTFFDSTK